MCLIQIGGMVNHWGTIMHLIEASNIYHISMLACDYHNIYLHTCFHLKGALGAGPFRTSQTFKARSGVKTFVL